MYTRIRQYRVKDPEEAVRRGKESFLPLARKIPGFLGYYLARTEDGMLVSISVFETREGAEEVARMSDQWNAEHWEDLLETTGETIIGEIIVAEMPEHAREERRAA